MGSFSDTPALIAGGDIYPFRFVKPSTAADDTGLQAAEATTPILGVTDGSTKTFSNGTASVVHAASGDPITLQGGANGTILVICSGNITRGAFVESDADGKAQTATTTTGTRYHGFVALQNGAAGQLIRIQRVAGMRTY
jgi:hypothetical protein